MGTPSCLPSPFPTPVLNHLENNMTSSIEDQDLVQLQQPPRVRDLRTHLATKTAAWDPALIGSLPRWPQGGVPRCTSASSLMLSCCWRGDCCGKAFIQNASTFTDGSRDCENFLSLQPAATDHDCISQLVTQHCLDLVFYLDQDSSASACTL